MWREAVELFHSKCIAYAESLWELEATRRKEIVFESC